MNFGKIENKKGRWLGVVLAGGRSSRMGVDKRALIFEGKTLLERTIGLLEKVVGMENVLVSGTVAGRPSAVPDVESGLGPVGGLRSILLSDRVRDGSWILLVPVDMPGLNDKILGELKLAAEKEEDSDLSGVQFEGRELPVAFRISSRVRRTVSGLCHPESSDRERSFRVLWKQLDFRSLCLSTEWEPRFKNLNTGEDWDEFLKGAHESKIG